MFPTDWVKERIVTLAKHHAVVWVEDPYRLLDDADLERLRAESATRGQTVTRVERAYRLRQFLDGIDPVGSSPKFVVVDQAYTTRDPHVLPQDAKPSNLLPLTAPDWKPFVPADARFRPTVRDFLIEATGFDDWPNQVNIYLVRFKDGDKWLYRVPDDSEASSLRKARQTGLGRRIRQYVAFLHGEGEYPDERKPDVKTLCMWLKHCANFGLPEAGVALFEKGGLAAQLAQLQEDLRYDAEDCYAQCRRRAGRHTAEDVEEEDDETSEGVDE